MFPTCFQYMSNFHGSQTEKSKLKLKNWSNSFTSIPFVGLLVDSTLKLIALHVWESSGKGVIRSMRTQAAEEIRIWDYLVLGNPKLEWRGGLVCTTDKGNSRQKTRSQGRTRKQTLGRRCDRTPPEPQKSTRDKGSEGGATSGPPNWANWSWKLCSSDSSTGGLLVHARPSDKAWLGWLSTWHWQWGVEQEGEIAAKETQIGHQRG